MSQFTTNYGRYKFMEYKSKYKTKSLSVYGECHYDLVNSVINHTNINGNKEDINILIPNCQDGIYVIPFAKKGFNVTCYEDNKILLNGGIIDDFSSMGLKSRIEYAGLKENIKLFDYNFYCEGKINKYDLVIAIKTLQLKENNKYSIKYKINHLMDSVKDNGFLYITYYLNMDSEIAKTQQLKKDEILKYIDLNHWTIKYYRENYKRKTLHHKHPYNKKNHYHYVGTILLQKTPYHYIKRKFARTYKTKSVYGECNQQIHDYLKLLQNEGKENNVLIVDANDGKNVISIARKNFNVTCYEDNKILLNGGIIDDFKTDGLKKRIKDYSIEDNVSVIEKNYYEIKDINKYNFIYVEDSLNLEKNKHIPMVEKIRKLMSNVKVGGYLYIYYDLSDSDNDSNRYLKKGEMKQYVDLENWKIVYICERVKSNYHHYINEENISRRTGYILIQKKSNKRVLKYNYKIEINNELLL